MAETADIRRFERMGWELWLSPLIAAALWGVLLARTDGQLALARSVVFVGGPVVLLAGLLERLHPFLHAPHRRDLLVLPVPSRVHFRSADAVRRRGLWLTALAGTLAVAIAGAVALRPAGHPPAVVAWLVVDWLWLLAMAALVEPAIAAAAATWGRRFDPDSGARRLQLQAGGGWTLPEAVVHLYAPALGVGVAASLALPGQLAVDRIADTGATTLTPGLWAAALVPIALGLAARLWAPHGYGRGVFEAAAWLGQATRSLAGPPIPDPAPRWVRALPQPALRLWVLQLWRVTPVPGLRLWALLGAGVWIGWTGAMGPSALAVLGALSAAWLIPALRVAKLAPGRAAFLAATPLPARQRTGRLPTAAVVLVVPPLVALGISWAGLA